MTGYFRHTEGLRVFNEFAQGVGEARSREAGMPQGCPFSMAFLGLLTVTWRRFLQSEASEAWCRILADDLMVVTGLGQEVPPETVGE
eukprot:7873349-Alexandrium_andersonii.AAC.1